MFVVVFPFIDAFVRLAANRAFRRIVVGAALVALVAAIVAVLGVAAGFATTGHMVPLASGMAWG